MAKLRAALVGCRGRGLRHADGYVKAEGMELVAAADNTPQNLEGFKKQFSGNTYDSAEEMFEKEKPDVVSLVTKCVQNCLLTESVKEKSC